LGFDYFVYGLRLRSNLPLPGVILENSSADAFDVAIHLGFPPYSNEKDPPRREELIYISSDTNPLGEPMLRISRVEPGGYVRLAYEDGTQFWVDRKQENVWATWAPESPLENTAAYLLGPVLGVVLRLRGVICLHASAVCIKDRAIALLGPAGAGKSTTAAAFAREGYGVISDDIVALENRGDKFMVMPAYPQLRLWPDSVEMLYGSPEALPCFMPVGEKRLLDLESQGAHFERRPLRLGAVYVLGDRRQDPAPYAEPVRPQNALLLLVADTYANKILDRELRAREFAMLGQLVTKVPIRRVYPCEERGKLVELCKFIHEDFESLNSPNPAQRGSA
jgi:hypothetical protein